ncbi:hypothetical protein [Aliarcobacter cibarius]|jgi:hypothetical protein|uniref:Uncharacterized protein n=1 Tax=Aliarcobacter cibarius TaxID=255507 RepID=A0A5J6RK40_9BACT|nr:hypothetical protein [Aliarcobacter cibarius]QEZ89168.1 hypothetical protein ACIB15232_1051 [Aliarcobacter cibarius]QKJ27203.1 hypothetical protein ACBT_1294 [Aliarcobacter cibarius]TLT01577.1 hypothetical protein FE247_01445 [Aliarcobacter cibarius]TLT02068.1 hypothetical protein FE245_01445 [Aliarcobacter cibarius]TLT04090.1 hypothetical protein FE248_04840 [Aliarcobacter cibarius]
MIVCVNKESIYSLFGVDDFVSLETALDNIAPSLLDYHFKDFCDNSEEVSFFNKREVENSFSQGSYTLFLDYNENLFLEIDDLEVDDSTSSFW